MVCVSFRAQLPEYILDFGYIILGTIRTHVVRITNTGQFPVSFYADRRELRDTGNGNQLLIHSWLLAQLILKTQAAI